MATIRETKKKTFAIIASAQTILDKYPQLSDINSLLSINTSVNPFDFLNDLLRAVGGYDKLVHFIAKLIKYELPAVELAIKTLLITNLKDFISCSINPFISERILKEGLTFNLNEVDLTGILWNNPLDEKIGKYFYFDTDIAREYTDDGIIYHVDELKKSLDFNSFLWYIININDDNIGVWDNRNSQPDETKRKDIITVRFVERAEDILLQNASNVYTGYYLQVPYNDAIQVFIGNITNEDNSLKNNPYYKKTLVQFNYDFVNSIKLFDAEVVAAQLMEALAGVFTINASLTVQQQLIRKETKEIIRRVIETDDSSVSDCFFSFSNDEYDNMLSMAEKRYAGLLSTDGETNGNATINPEDLLSKLNGLSSAASPEEQVTIIEGMLYELSAELSKVSEGDRISINPNIQLNFIDRILEELTAVLVTAVLSPKMYILFAVNFKLMGLPGMPDIRSFMEMSKNMLVQIIRLIRDIIIRYVMDFLMELLRPLIEELSSRMIIETAYYYTLLIKQLIKACSFSRSSNGILDWEQDQVNYADIVPTEQSEASKEC